MNSFSKSNKILLLREIFLFGLFFVFLNFSNINAQNYKVIELAISYDEHFYQIHGNQSMQKIQNAIAEVNTFYQNKANITFQIVAINRINIGTPPVRGDFWKPRWSEILSGAWKKYCVNRDLVHHFTGLDLPMIGGFVVNLSALCNSNADDFNYNFDEIGYVGFSEGIIIRPYNTAHELGHQLGLSHTPICNGPFLMCENGGGSLSTAQFTTNDLSTLSHVKNNVPCVNSSLPIDNNDCLFEYTVTSNSLDFSLGCGAKPLNWGYTLNNNYVARSLVTECIYNSNEINILNKNPEFGQPIPYSVAPYNSKIVLTKNISANEDFSIDIKFDVINAHLNDDNTNFFTNISCKNIINPNPLGNPFLTFGVYAFGEKLYDMSNIPIVYSNQLPSLCNCVINNVIPKKFDFDGTLIINNNTTFNKSSEITMTAKSQIIVENGGTLTLKGTEIYACGDNLWKGIIVKAGGKLIIEEGAIISDALNAISIEQGSIVTMNKSFLNDCHKGVVLQEGAELYSFFSNIIQTLNGVKPSLDPTVVNSNKTIIGVVLNKNSTAYIGSSAIEGNSGNTFTDMTYGIYCDGGTVFAQGNKFDKIGSEVFELESSAIYILNSPYYDISYNKMSNLGTGVFAYNSGGDIRNNEIVSSHNCVGILRNTGLLTTIRDNYLIGRNRVIYVAKSSNTTIHDNSIKFYGNEVGDIATGIYLSFSHFNKVYENTLQVLTQKPEQYGIISQVCTFNEIYDNNINCLPSAQSIAIGFMGGDHNSAMCNWANEYQDGLYMDNSPGNEMLNNVLGSLSHDINIENNSILQLLKGNTLNANATNLRIANPIGSQTHHGNIWSPTADLGADASLLLPEEIGFSRFLVDFQKSDTQNKNWYPKKNGLINSDPADLFLSGPDNNGTYLGSDCTFGFFNGWFITSNSPELLCSWLKNPNNRLSPAMLKWWKQYLYRLMLKSKKNYSLYASCLQELQADLINSDVHKVENIRDGLTKLTAINMKPDVNSKYEALRNIVYPTIDFNNASTVTSVRNQVADISTSIINNQTAISTIAGVIHSEISALGADYGDEKLVYNALLQFSNNGTKPADNSVFRSLANECTLEKGENVHFAKSLISLTEIESPMGISCSNLNLRSSEKVVKTSEIKIAPTVSEGLYMIEHNLSDQTITMQVYDLNGNLISTKQNISTVSMLDLQTYAAGLYFVRIIDQSTGDVLDTKKLVKF